MLELLDQMHKEKPDLQAAFVTAYDQYAFDAYQLDACDYLLKPFGQEEVDRALDKARRLVRTEQKDEMQLEIHTFGRFDLFLNDHAIDFSSRKNCLHFLWQDGAALWKWNLPWICYGKKNRSVNR